ncbi:hypothetical protein M5K25_022269 [Dendrobium thyrsiflorum]|uniref:Uncharacterized protein n=1 Tax=Dendrobium thyrsiflorum TaxID=117978 RepID=A0ABD0UC78_DENTH
MENMCDNDGFLQTNNIQKQLKLLSRKGLIFANKDASAGGRRPAVDHRGRRIRDYEAADESDANPLLRQIRPFPATPRQGRRG